MPLLDRVQEVLLGKNGNDKERMLAEKLSTSDLMVSVLQENLQSLELQMDEEGWRVMSFELEQEFTRRGLDLLTDMSRAMYLANPLIQRAVNVTGFYVWAQGVTVTAADQKVQDDVVIPMMDDWTNKEELFSPQARLLTETDQMVDGNVFLGLPTDTTTGDVKIRAIPSNEIREIITMPGDRAVVMYYRRIWVERTFDEKTGVVSNTTKEALYPDWRWYPAERPEKAGTYTIHWDAPVIHRRSGGLKQMRFGVPETYAAQAWARAYKGFLEDWHTIVKSLARFAWKSVAKGKGKAKRTKDKLQSAIEESGEPDQNPPPGVGSVWISSEEDSMAPIAKTGAHTSAEDARPSRLMVATAMNLPDTILSGDVDVGNFATSKTLDRPTELYMATRQTLGGDLYRDIFHYGILARVRYGTMGGNDATRGGLIVTEPTVDTSIEVSFPPILEDDKKANVDAIVSAATLSGHPDAGVMPTELTAKMLLEALNVEDVEEALKDLPEQEAEELAEAIKGLQEVLRGHS